MPSTKAWLRVKAGIEHFAKNPIEGRSVPAVRANPRGKDKTMASRKQIAAARRNIKKAQAARKTNPKKKRRARKKRRRNATTTARRKNTWKGAPRRHAKAARKGVARKKRRLAKRRKTSRRRRRNPTATRAANPTGVKVVKVPGATKVVRVGASRSAPRKTRQTRQSNPVKRRRKNPRRRSTGLARRSSGTPTFGGLFKNPGPFTMASLKGWGVAAVGVGSGLYGADILDRYIATRTPEEGNHPWYGSDAAAAQRRRPDAYRLGGQAALALAAMAATYFTRRGKILPWLFGGTSVGAGANLFKMIMDWWVSPAVFKVDNPSDESLANRLFPLEQADVQDTIDEMFENWPASPQLAAAQTETSPVIRSPLGGANAYVLGKAGKPSQAFYKTGRLGKCGSCGGDGGCYEGCSDFCPPCSYNVGVSGVAPECNYEVKPGDNFSKIAALSGVDVNVVNSMNSGQPADYWKVGANVKLPYVMCKDLASKLANGGAVAGQPAKQVQPKPVIPKSEPAEPLVVPSPVPALTQEKPMSKEAKARSFGQDAE